MDDARLRAALGYLKFRRTPRVLIFDSGYLVVGDAINAAEDLGWKVAKLPAQKKGSGENQFVAALLTALVTYQPDFVLTINHIGFDETGVLAALLERYDIPTASWFVDHPMPILGAANKNATSNLQLFCFERTAFPWLSNNGYGEAVFLPTGANGRFFNAEKTDPLQIARFRFPLSFVGHSWWLKARVEPSKPVRKAAKELWNKQKVNRATLVGLCEKLLEKEDRELFAAVQVALAEASMDTRKKLIDRFRELNVTLFGDKYWEKLCPGVKVFSPLDYHNELPALFMGSDVNLNVTAEHMPTSVNQRVWDVPAVGGFLLTDAQEDALNVFVDGESMAFYTSLDEAGSKARFYLAHAEIRARISLKGAAIIHQSHLMTHRLQYMYNVMKKRFG